MPQDITGGQSQSPDAQGSDATPSIRQEYRQNALRSHARLRRQRDRQLRQLPFLHEHVTALQAECDGLKNELAAARRQQEAYRQEVLTLRNLIHYAQHPPPPAAAAAAAIAAATNDAAVVRLKEEVMALQRLVRELQRDKEACLLQSEEACDAAEFYRRLARSCTAETHLTADGDTATSAMVQELAASCCGLSLAKKNRPGELRRAAGAARDALVTRAEAEFCCGSVGTSSPVAHDSTCERSAVSETSSCGTSTTLVPGSGEADGGCAAVMLTLEPPEGRCHDDHSRKTAVDGARVRGYSELLRSQNRLLVQRVAELAQRNVDYAREVAALKLARTQRVRDASLQL